MRTFSLPVLGIALCLTAMAAGASAPLLLQQPSLSRTQIVFAFAGDLWTVSRDGGDAQRLTSGPGVESDPYFSPDGTQIAFSGEYDGNVDVYVVPSVGGVPKRLTWHPDPDQVCGWTPDSKQVLFRSSRSSYSRFRRLFTVPVEGGNPTELQLYMAASGSYSPDGREIAYMPLGSFRPPHSYDAWKRYRGGRTTAVWIAHLEDSSVVKIPRQNSNDSSPMWIGDTVYFLSDRDGPVTLFAYDLKTKRVTKLIRNQGLDMKSASAGPGAIVYEQFGAIRLYDLKTKQVRAVDITVNGDLPEVRPRFEKAASFVRAGAISPTGARAVFEARGEILTVPAEKGDARNLTNTTGVHERSPAWSPDGRSIAYFSDESGEYALHIRAQNGLTEPRKFALPGNPAFCHGTEWSPDGKKILFLDNRLNVLYLDVDTGSIVKVATDTYYDGLGSQRLDPAWSPDSKWIVYTKQLVSHLRAVFVYSLNSERTHQLTDGMSDSRYAVFDPDGKYIYFTASTNAGLTAGWLDLSSSERPVTRSVYLMVLRKDDPSPLAPESDEEKEKMPEGKKEADKKQPPLEVRIDVEDIGQRILALPIPARNYDGLAVGKPGTLFLKESALIQGLSEDPPTLHKFDLKKRKIEKFLDAVDSFDVSRDGEKLLYCAKQRCFITGTAAAPKPGDGALKMDALEVYVDPRAEWRQMFHEVWRIERDFFYDPNLHGLDWKAASARYEPYLEKLASRVDLNYLFQEMLGSITVGHLYIRGGEVPQARHVTGGLLGADYRVEKGRYRFAYIYDGENWNPSLRAPLTQPGVKVKIGDYLLAVNGRDVLPTAEIHSYLEGTAGKQVVLKVGPDPSGARAREVTVVPVESETSLRYRKWVEDNRRQVDRRSGGRVAYMHLPDTAQGGYTSFNRYFFAQVGKQAAVVDERFNGGGSAADYVVDYLRRPLLNYWTTRYGADFTTPLGAIFGPKVMIVNEFAGSGGDAMPWYFRRLKIGPLVGTRTWGGLVGILGFPPLMDGGSVTAPNLAFYNPEAQWDVENHGVAPDIEVEMDPRLVRQGHDPQLEKAVAVVLEALKKSPVPAPRKPPYPKYN